MSEPVCPSKRLPARGRLKRRADYLRVQRTGRKYQLRDVLVFVLPSEGERRVGFTVSKKVGNAVVRNAVKRLLREAWRQEQHRMPRRLDIVLVARKSARDAELRSLRTQMIALVRKMSRR